MPALVDRPILLVEPWKVGCAVGWRGGRRRAGRRLRLAQLLQQLLLRLLALLYLQCLREKKKREMHVYRTPTVSALPWPSFQQPGGLCHEAAIRAYGHCSRSC